MSTRGSPHCNVAMHPTACLGATLTLAAPTCAPRLLLPHACYQYATCLLSLLSLPQHILPRSRHPTLAIPDPRPPSQPDHELCQKLLKEEEERDIQATEQATGRSRRELWETGETWERDLKRARVEGRGAAPGGSHEINPLMDIYQEAPYEQVMQWFQEFLQYDDRTPAEVRSLLALHFSARDRQLLAGMDADTTGGRERFFGVPLRRFG